LGTLTADIQDTEQVIGYLLGDWQEKYAEADVDMLRRAYEFARNAHQDQKRANGDPYIYHCIEVAKILADRRMDAQTIAAALLHDTVEDCNVKHGQLAEEFGPDIADLVEGVTKISALHFGSRREQQVENLRKMILAMAKDIRVIIIKLADRLHNLRTLKYLPPEKQIKISQDTMDIYAPLANRLGMTRIKSELEDGAMYFLHPDEYREISRLVALKRAEREALVQKSIEILRTELDANGIKADIQGRSKHLHSIYLKMDKQHLAFDEIYDLIGLRVICESVGACYDILGIVHNMWRPIHGRFKDYIAMPKENMYQSLHTTVVGLGGERLEIQVRTAEMHKFAEEGIAAHWKYKEGRKGRHDMEEKLLWLRRLTDWLNDVHDPSEFMDALKKDVFSDTVFCFTPAGDVIELPSGSTPLDFAYHIHSNIGETCVGAKVNKKIVPLRYTLQNGDFVEIITSKNGHPSADWLDIVKTSRARTKIKHYLKTKNFQENIEHGRDMLAKSLRARNIRIDWDEIQQKLLPLLKSFKVNSFDELLGEVGFGGLMAQNVILRAYPDAPEAPRQAPRKGVRKKASSGVIIEGLTNTMIRYAACCSPVPGDPIVGFVTIGRGVTIHNKNCPNLRSAINNNGSSEKLVQADWDMQHLPVRRVSIRVECIDRKGLLADVTGTITSMNIFILESKTKSKADVAILKFLIEVRDLAQLNHLMNQLKQVKGVIDLSRSSRNEVA
jgi:GTP diphosphokinase / guanosine-3',5'-bis(diphosphate) 3'-diphosphatase